MLKVAIKY